MALIGAASAGVLPGLPEPASPVSGMASSGVAPMADTAERFEALLAAGKDSPMLRLALGTEYLKRDDPEASIRHLTRAVELEPEYSAAWQHLGRAFERNGRPDEAAAAWGRGIDAAERRGDAQAAKVMRVWLRRLERRAGDGDSAEREPS